MEMTNSLVELILAINATLEPRIKLKIVLVSHIYSSIAYSSITMFIRFYKKIFTSDYLISRT